MERQQKWRLEKTHFNPKPMNNGHWYCHLLFMLKIIFHVQKLHFAPHPKSTHVKYQSSELNKLIYIFFSASIISVDPEKREADWALNCQQNNVWGKLGLQNGSCWSLKHIGWIHWGSWHMVIVALLQGILFSALFFKTNQSSSLH